MSQPNTPAETLVDTSNLFDEFSPVSRQAWEALIRKDLKLETAADYERKTLWRTAEGFDVQPFYDRQDLEKIDLPEALPGQFPFLRGNHTENNAWEIREEIYDVDPTAANRRARTALEAGVDSVVFVFTAERGELRGVDISGDVSSDFQKLVDGIWLDAAGIHFRSGIAAPLALALLSEEVRRQNLDPTKVRGSVGFDPMSDLAREGELDVRAAVNLATGLVQFAHERLPGVRTLCVSDTVFHNAGAGIVESLALSLAAGSDLLARMTETSADVSVAQICGSLAFDFSISANYFMEIARMRAARLLWARIVQAYNPEDLNAGAMYIHGRTSAFNQTMYDPHVNLLRATTEAMSAALGACDAFTVSPFDSALHLHSGDEFSARMARNTQQVLKHEAYLDKVIDPAAGSYYLENLTDQIARQAWAAFQEIEAAGGFVAAFQSGLIQKKIETSAAVSRAVVASRKQTILGTNQYPNPADRALDKIESDKIESAKLKSSGTRSLPAAAGVASPAKLTGPAASAERIQFLDGLPALASQHGVAAILADLRGTPDVSAAPLHTFRIAEDFERLRLSTERFVAGGGRTPRVFLLTFGDLAMRKARAMFAANFFACAGYESMDPPGFASAHAGVDAALASGAEIVVFCSSDAEYAEQAGEAAALLKAAGTVQVVVAGNPVEDVDRLRAAGVQFFIHAKSNALEVLGEFHKVLGI